MTCFYCKGNIESSTTTYMTDYQGCYIIIKNVPCEKCSQCGEEYSDGDANNWLSCMTIAPDCSVTPDQVMDALAEYNIETRPIWKPMHLQPVFADCDFIQVKEGRSVSEDIFNRGVCLPSDIKNTPEDMELIISLIRKVFEK